MSYSVRQALEAVIDEAIEGRISILDWFRAMASKLGPKATKPDAAFRQIGVRGSKEWVRWLERFAAFCRTDTSKVIDAALVDYAKARGFDEPAPPRL